MVGMIISKFHQIKRDQMAKIIKIEDRNVEKPTISGDAVCIICKHRWKDVAPLGTEWLECPKCSVSRGHFVYAVVRDIPHWFCGCGNKLFYMTKYGVDCPVCGNWQQGF